MAGQWLPILLLMVGHQCNWSQISLSESLAIWRSFSPTSFQIRLSLGHFLSRFSMQSPWWWLTRWYHYLHVVASCSGVQATFWHGLQIFLSLDLYSSLLLVCLPGAFLLISDTKCFSPNFSKWLSRKIPAHDWHIWVPPLEVFMMLRKDFGMMWKFISSFLEISTLLPIDGVTQNAHRISLSYVWS